MFGFDQMERRLTQALQTLRFDMDHRLKSLEGLVKDIATREELDAAKTQLRQAIEDAAMRVATTIQELRDDLAKGETITDADLADLQTDIQELAGIDAPTPPPTP